jgi:hypothetical protein
MRQKTPFVLSLSKDRSSSLHLSAKQGQGFDKLSPNGVLEQSGGVK